MQHIKLARDRRKQKLRTKAVIFFPAILFVALGIILSLHIVNSAQISSNKSVKKSAKSTALVAQNIVEGITNTGAVLPNLALEFDMGNYATSYDDYQGKDDESEEVLQEDEFGSDFADLPANAKDVVSDILDIAGQAIRIINQFNHNVVKGDTLKDVLELSGIEDNTAEKLIASFPELKHLQAGQQFYWILNNAGELEYLNWLVSREEERIYERVENNEFKRQILEKKSVWKQEVLRGEVDSTLVASLKTLGLNARQISQLTSALQWQVNLSKLKKGSKVVVYVFREYLGENLTGQGKVEAIRINTNGKDYYAIQADNGRYYNLQGETLGKTFARYPLQRQARVSSPFNLNRRHPITKKIAPHKGVDFALSIGTPVIAPADGSVEKVAYQANGAGRYIVIRHTREYQTVYMHLSKSLVKAGQRIKKGERIALSGNTGRSTGPHLHYEFHINGRPVNPLTVKLPGTSSSMNSVELKQFRLKAKKMEKILQ